MACKPATPKVPVLGSDLYDYAPSLCAIVVFQVLVSYMPQPTIMQVQISSTTYARQNHAISPPDAIQNLLVRLTNPPFHPSPSQPAQRSTSASKLGQAGSSSQYAARRKHIQERGCCSCAQGLIGYRGVRESKPGEASRGGRRLR